jgi:hypothetical protein
VEVLQQDRAARAGGDRVLVVGDGDAGGGGKVGHGSFLVQVIGYRILLFDSFLI